MMPITYAKINTATASGSSNIVSFGSIPSTFTDLVLLINGRSNNASSADTITLRFNGSTSGYSNNTVYSEGNGIGFFRPAIQYIHAGYLTANNKTAGYSGNIEIYIGSYSSSVRLKPVLTLGGMSSSSTGYQSNIAATEYAYWNNTSPVTSIDITMESGGNFTSGTKFSLYGIKQA